MDDQQERDLVRGLREGKPEAWRLLYDAFAEQVWRSVARLMGPDSAEIADVVQETFMAAARSARTYDAGRGSLWGWLWGIARRSVALHFRKRERQDRLRQARAGLAASNGEVRVGSGLPAWLGWLEHDSATPVQLLATAELATLVRTVLTDLPDAYESVLTAKYLDGISVEGIAEIEHCSATAVRSKLARARRAFRDLFLKISTSPLESS